MNKKNLIFGIIIIVALVGGVFYKVKYGKTLLGSSTQLYADKTVGFSIQLPKDWAMLDKSVATTSAEVWFKNPKALPGEDGASMVVGRYDRNELSDKLISQIGDEKFIFALAADITSRINKYALVATSTEVVNGRLFTKIEGEYEGLNSSKKVKQFLYLNLADGAYYLIGVDVYTDLLPKLETGIMNSVKSFKMLK